MKSKKTQRSNSIVEVPPSNADQTVVTAIVKVASDGYVPSNAILRSQIGPRIITVEILANQLAGLDADPEVESFSLARSLPLQRPPSAT